MLRAQPVYKLLGSKIFQTLFFPAVVPHEGYGAMFFVSDVLPASVFGFVVRTPFWKGLC